MKTDFYIGIDPGLLGGIAILSRAGAILRVERMPETDKDVLTVFQDLNRLREPGTVTRACLERAQSSPQMGVVSAFKFGVGYGALRMVLASVEIPFDEPTPLKWQRAMNCVDTKAKARQGTKDKNVTKRRAQQLFPQITVTHRIADALLLAEYCRRFFTAGSSTIQE